MSNTRDLYDEKAVEKIKELVKDITSCMFCTKVTDMPFRTRPMATIDVDAEGNLWFFSSTSSDKNVEIKNNDVVQLLYAKNSDSHFLTITGNAEIVKDPNKIDELWSAMVKAWFPEGKEDPDLSLIKVVPKEAHYWDTVHGKMVTLLKIAASAVSGNKVNEGVEGEIKV
jgi:general stress protein 26